MAAGCVGVNMLIEQDTAICGRRGEIPPVGVVASTLMGPVTTMLAFWYYVNPEDFKCEAKK